MISVAKKELSILQFTNLGRFAEVMHFSSTRLGGSSTNSYDSLNLGFNSGDLPENVGENRNKLCRALEINPCRMVFPNQTHSGTVRIIDDSYFVLGEDERKRFLGQTDAVITNLPGACLAVKTADCVPVLLFDRKRKVVAAVHAGWRGTVQNIVSKTIQCMSEEYGTEPSDLFAGIGPSISPEIYEVGEEVWKQFEPTFYHNIPENVDKRLLDLWSANFHDLSDAGVPKGQIEVARICTLTDPVHFFSARRDGAKTGRMATGIMLR